MWLNITVLVIIFIIVLLSFGGLVFVENITEDLENSLNILEEKIQREQWDAAKTIYKNVNKSWGKATNIFPLILDHAEFHDLEIALSRIGALIQQKNRANILPEIKISLDLLDNIKKQQKLSVENIF
jgi:hypothetical protein